jgi:hypothetical protein
VIILYVDPLLYAAEEFAKVAGVPFKHLSSYERKAVRGYVG